MDFGPTFRMSGLNGHLSLFIDNIGYSFSLLTTLIGFFVFIYAFSYMRFERNVLNFLGLLKAFELSMVLLVLAGSWFTLLLGWELIGITSFLLINFWTVKITTLKSAFKAFAFNKISDCALLLAFIVHLLTGSGYFFNSISSLGGLSNAGIYIGYAYLNYSSVFLFCLITASFCKSAQIGLHFWLPDSMEAPVPASALIHSATLVSAGIYLLLRYNVLFLSSPILYNVFMLLTGFTAFFGAVVACNQTDVKKILAYSTISHCGMLMFSIGLFNPYVTISYLFAHGFFKSLNFMCAGNFIQYSNNMQDVSRMGSFANLFSFEYYFFCITLFNLSSVPFFFCFFSKHWLLGTVMSYNIYINIALSFMLAAATCGFLYSAKILYHCLCGGKRAHRSAYTIYAICSEHISLIRRANRIGLIAMVGLFVVAILVLYNIALIGPDELSNTFDSNGSLATIRHTTSFYMLHVALGLLMLFVASGYITYKSVPLTYLEYFAYFTLVMVTISMI